jgi:hypothetical protein
LHHALTALGADVIARDRDGVPLTPLFGGSKSR